jgi:hypothetical protein
VRIATGPDGRWGVVLESDGAECRIRELRSGNSRWVPHSSLSSTHTASLHQVGQEVPDPVRASVAAIRTPRGWGLTLVVGAASPVAVRELLEATTECESDLNGLLAELEAGGILERSELGGERAYELSDPGASAVESVRSGST